MFMKCAQCGVDAPVIEHQFLKGTREKPERVWSVFAPLYYKSNKENTACIEGYCSCKCSTEKYNLDLNKDKPQTESKP